MLAPNGKYLLTDCQVVASRLGLQKHVSLILLDDSNMPSSRGPVETLRAVLPALAVTVAAVLWASPARPGELPPLRSAAIGDGISLHYVEQGSGPALVFVHGSVSDLTYWQGQVEEFAKHFRVVAYSRRYNEPNHNPDRPDYSAVIDAEDLASLIDTLHLGRVYVIGHSYGALTALFLAKTHPEKLRAIVLAEPPAVSLLKHLSPPATRRGEEMFADIEKRMVAPMKAAFARHDTDAGVETFIDYVFAQPGAWRNMSTEARAETVKDAREWEVMMTSGTLFPDITIDDIRRIKVPTLLMSGDKSYPFLGLVDRELERTLPHVRRIHFVDTGHQMWLTHPADCRADAEAFFEQHR